MIEKFLNSLLTSTMQRVVIVMILSGLPMAVSVCYLGAAYQQSTWGIPLGGVFLKAFVGYLIVMTLAGVFQYFLERFVVQRQFSASGQSIQRGVFRLLIAIGFGTLGGWLVQFVMRSMAVTGNTVVESSYYVISLAQPIAVIVTYTLLEGALEEVKRRETRLKQVIENLHVKIDELQRQKDVSEIVDNPSFDDLKARAEALKQKNRARLAGSSA